MNESKHFWPDGTPKHINVCKSELQLLSEIHLMLTNMTIRNQLIDLTEGSPIFDSEPNKTPEITIKDVATAFIFDPEIAKGIKRLMETMRHKE